MKSLLIILVAAIGTLTLSCKKDKNTSGTIYRGVVIDAICGNIVVQTVGTAHLGQENWIDLNKDSKPVCHYVFSVANPCDFSGGNQPDTFNFIVSTPKIKDCFQCMAALPYMPDVKYSIERVK